MLLAVRAEHLRRRQEPASLIQASKLGWGLTESMPGLQRDLARDGWSEKPQAESASLEARLLAARHGLCQCGANTKYELGMAAMSLAARGLMKPGEKVPKNSSSKPSRK